MKRSGSVRRAVIPFAGYGFPRTTRPPLGMASRTGLRVLVLPTMMHQRLSRRKRLKFQTRLPPCRRPRRPSPRPRRRRARCASPPRRRRARSAGRVRQPRPRRRGGVRAAAARRGTACAAGAARAGHRASRARWAAGRLPTVGKRSRCRRRCRMRLCRGSGGGMC
jgi:hypothetical protein